MWFLTAFVLTFLTMYDYSSAITLVWMSYFFGI